VFYQREKWLREHYLCIRCGSIPRFRSLILVLDQTYPDWRDLRIFESSPAGASSNKIARECRRYVSAHFFPEIPLGESRNGIRCENIEKMTFPDSSFDLVVTQDVLEHVFHPDAAFREIARILAPGGAHIFTTPVLLDKQTVVRAVEEDGNVKHLLPPQYHGNPIDPEGSLVVRDWGGDIVAYIKASSGLKTEVLDFDDPRKGLVAEYLQVFVTRRPL
jgi:SAM-dependent methyltransferase